MATPSAIRAALVKAAAPRLLNAAVNRLAARYPDLSARRVATACQGAGAVLLAAVIAAGVFLDAKGTLVAVNLVGATLFFGVSSLRFVAVGFAERHKPATPALPPGDADDLPVYTILVPLYREAHLVADVVRGLRAIDWPGIMAQTPLSAFRYNSLRIAQSPHPHAVVNLSPLQRPPIDLLP